LTDDAHGEVLMIQQSYRRFLWTFFGTSAIVFAALWAWAAVGRLWYMDSEYPLWLYKDRMLTESCFEGKTVILGDSRPMADLVPKELGDGVYNLAIGGLTPIELYYAVEKMKHCKTMPKAVVLSMAPFHFMAMESYWGRTLPFQFLRLGEALEVQSVARKDRRQNIYRRDIFGTIGDAFTTLLITANVPTFYFTKLIDGALRPNIEMNRWSLGDLESSRGHVAMLKEVVVTQPSAESSFGRFAAFLVADVYWRKSLQSLAATGTRVYYIDMPITPLTDASLPENYREDYGGYVKESLARHPDMHFVGDVLPTRKLSNFSDPFHLNQRGAIEYSREIRASFP
jgi:hypothetical protein